MAVGTSNLHPSENKEVNSKYTRLHITPLNPTLLPSILPPAVLTTARDISYHSLQTFPEKEFGFLDLPNMEAQKIKKKLNGSILKGTKIKIEDARPSKKRPADEETTLPTARVSAKGHNTPLKKRKRDTEALPGIELRDRQVKRGWTDPVPVKRVDKKSKGKKDVVKSKYSSGPELLFRTSLPANKVAPTGNVLNLKAERKRRKHAKDVVVHEFSKTTKHPSFLRSSTVPSTANGVAEYIDGKGWVGASGNIVEAPVTRPTRTMNRKLQNASSSSGSSVTSEVEETSDTEESDEEIEEELSNVEGETRTEVLSTSSSGTSSDEEDGEDGGVLSDSEAVEEEPPRIYEETNNTSSLPSPKTPVSLKLDIPKTESPRRPDLATAVHPLEALFKRRRPNFEAPKIPEAVPSFSFFDADDHNDEKNDVEDSIPMTPYTKQDFTLRGLRSAAPTPDTAFPGNSYTTWPTDHASKREDADFEIETSPTQKYNAKGPDLGDDSAAAPAPVSDFQKWFYEHRGENNRAWKRRRKLAAKEKRHRENKKRSERNM